MKAIEPDETKRMAARYEELIGFVPPRIRARLKVSGQIDPTHLRLQEEMRLHCMYPSCFDVKTAQLMLFGMLLMTTSDAAKLHGLAARRAGASWEELHAVAAMAGLFRGLSAMNLGAEMLDQIMQAEEASAAGERT